VSPEKGDASQVVNEVSIAVSKAPRKSGILQSGWAMSNSGGVRRACTAVEIPDGVVALALRVLSGALVLVAVKAPGVKGVAVEAPT
jgi:hypothetical protein